VPWLTALFPPGAARHRALFSDGALAAIVAASFLLPHAVTVGCAPRVAARGSVAVLRDVFRARAALAGAAALATVAAAAAGAPPPRAAAAAAAAYQLASRVSSEVVCRALPLARARLVDAAARAGGARGARRAAAVVGAAEFLPKLAGSLAPLVGFALVRAAAPGAAQAVVWTALIALPGAVALMQLAVVARVGGDL